MLEITDINNRVKLIRKKWKLTQIEFADRIGITQGTLSGIEKGNVSVSNQNIIAICREFDINESWLRNGVGEMQVEFDENEMLAKAVAKALKDEDDFTRNMFIEISKWTKEEREIMKKAIKIIKRSNL